MRYEIDVNGCWNWLGTTKNGYGYLLINGVTMYAHRLAYQLYIDYPHSNHHVHHTCYNRLCVNPAHLAALAPREHSRTHHPKKTHCKWGHPYDEANTYVTTTGTYQCRACKNRRQKERHARIMASHEQEATSHQSTNAMELS